MVMGVVLSESVLVLFGPGTFQLLSVILLALMLARLISPNPTFALTVAIQAVLVQLLQAPTGGDFARVIDGLIGGLSALAFTALVPRNPIRLARADSRLLFAAFKETLAKLREVLLTTDKATADLALENIRKTQPLVDNWRLSLDSAIAVARISPFLRKYRDELSGQVRLMRGMDLAIRNLRVVVRRVDFLVRDGVARPYLADLFEQISDAAKLLSQGLESAEQLHDAQEAFVEIIHQLDPKKFGIADQIREASVLLLLRPLLVDLLCASGMSEDDARAELPAI